MAFKWTDYLQCARVRAAEEADTQAHLWKENELTEISAQSKPYSPKHPEAYLKRRAELLVLTAKSPETLQSLRPARVPNWIKWVAWCLMFAMGASAAMLPSQQIWNLLDYPFWIFLAYHLVLYVLMMVYGERLGALPRFCRRLLLGQKRKLNRLAEDLAEEDAHLDVFAKIQFRFRHLAFPVLEKRSFHKSRQWFHLAAIAAALGIIGGLYFQKTTAVWQSRILNAGAAEVFFSSTLAPASWVLGQPVPTEAVVGMQRFAFQQAKAPSPAAPWTHLYAMTLVLVVIVPRGSMALWDQWQAARAHRNFLSEKGWSRYLNRLTSSLDGEGEVAKVLIYGAPKVAGFEPLLRYSLKQRWEDLGGMEYFEIPYGRDFAEDASKFPLAKRTVVVFNMAQTPELEVHRAWLEALIEALKTHDPEAEVCVVLEDENLRKRWGAFTDSGEKMRARQLGWERCLEGLSFEWVSLSTEF